MKTIKTLKRFYVLALLLCLGISQSWAGAKTETITLNAKDAENGVITWTTEDGNVTFTLTPVPTFENNIYELNASSTYTFSWTNNNPVKLDLKVSNFTARNNVNRRDNSSYMQGITFTCECGNASGNNTPATWIAGNGDHWEETSLNLSNARHNDDTFINIKTGLSEEGAGLASKSKFRYYIEWIKITYTLTEREFSAKVNATANIPAGAKEVKVNGKASDTQTDIISDALIAAGSKQYDFTLYAEPNEGYDFLGWSETQNEEDIVCEDREMPYSITCELSNIAIEKTWYAIFVKRFDKVAMGKKQDYNTINYYATASANNLNNVEFFIASSNSSRAIGNNASSSVAISLGEDGYYNGVNADGKPFTFTIVDGHLKCSNGMYVNANSSNNGILFESEGTTSWNVSRNNGSYRLYYTTGSGLNTRYRYITSPNNNGPFTITTTVLGTPPNVNIYVPTSKREYYDVDPLEFSIKADYATLYCEDAYQLPENTDIVGYFIKDAVKSGELTYEKKYESGDIVPAGTALLLTGTIKQDKYSATRYVEKAGGEKQARVYTDANQNQLEGRRRDDGYTWSERGDENVYYYQLTWKDKNNHDLGVYFYWGAADGAPYKMSNNYSAYLAVSKESNARSFNLPGFEDDDEVNSIDTVESDISNGAIYTVSGVRVNDTTNLPAGIYIRNGKKFIVR